jgi:Mg-chelatase subunit ChlI
MNVDGHRADLVILRGATAHAALRGDIKLTDQDILLAAELALPHRVKSRGFADEAVSAYDLEERLEQAQNEFGSGEFSESSDDQGDPSQQKKKRR